MCTLHKCTPVLTPQRNINNLVCISSNKRFNEKDCIWLIGAVRLPSVRDVHFHFHSHASGWNYFQIIVVMDVRLEIKKSVVLRLLMNSWQYDSAGVLFSSIAHKFLCRAMVDKLSARFFVCTVQTNKERNTRNENFRVCMLVDGEAFFWSVIWYSSLVRSLHGVWKFAIIS